MSIPNTTVRRSLVAAVALGAGLPLAACGGDDEPIAPPASDPATEETPVEPDAPETESDTTAETDAPTGPSESTEPAETDTETDTDSADETSAPAAGEDTIEFTWPDGWEDISDATGFTETPGVDEMHSWGIVEGTFATNVTAIRYSPGAANTDDYLELLAQSGIDTSAYTELPERDIDGHSVPGYESETDYGQGNIRQVAYGFLADDGSFVEIVLSSLPEEFDSHQADFDQILDSVVIH